MEFCGDSLTAGYPSTDSPALRYPEIYGESSSTLIAAINTGVSGERCDQIITDQWTAERVNGYSRVFIRCGVNDLNAGQSAASTWTEIQTLADQAIGLGAIPVVINVSPWSANTGSTASKQTETLTLNSLIAAGPYTYVDVYTPGEDPVGSGILKSVWDIGDGLHGTQQRHIGEAALITAVIAP